MQLAAATAKIARRSISVRRRAATRALNDRLPSRADRCWRQRWSPRATPGGAPPAGRWLRVDQDGCALMLACGAAMSRKTSLAVAGSALGLAGMALLGQALPVAVHRRSLARTGVTSEPRRRCGAASTVPAMPMTTPLTTGTASIRRSGATPTISGTTARTLRRGSVPTRGCSRCTRRDPLRRPLPSGTRWPGRSRSARRPTARRPG